MIDIIQDFIPVGRQNRPGYVMQAQYITIHDTDNTDAGAGAKAHASFIKNTPDKTSWHFTVDDKYIIQHLPLNETGYHAGDGSGPGNRNSIGIEICMNSDGNRTAAEANAAELVKYLYSVAPSLKPYPEGVKQHYDWTGKNCPSLIRSRPDGWQKFMALIKAKMEVKTVEPWKVEAIKTLESKGVIDVGKWKGDEPADIGMVMALILKVLKFIGKL